MLFSSIVPLAGGLTIRHASLFVELPGRVPKRIVSFVSKVSKVSEVSEVSLVSVVSVVSVCAIVECHRPCEGRERTGARLSPDQTGQTGQAPTQDRRKAPTQPPSRPLSLHLGGPPLHRRRDSPLVGQL